MCVQPFLVLPNELLANFQLLQFSFCGLPIQPERDTQQLDIKFLVGVDCKQIGSFMHIAPLINMIPLPVIGGHEYPPKAHPDRVYMLDLVH